MQPQPPPDKDPYRAVWQMSQVGDAAGGGSGRRIRWVAGILSGLVGFLPFAIVATVLWGFWSDDVNLNAGGWAVLLIGLAAGLSVGGYIATSDD